MMTHKLHAVWFLGIFAAGQSFDSKSTGSDRALNLTTPGTVIFDPAALNLNPAGDNVFNFTTINIGPGVIVKLLNGPLRDKPVVWLASGAVTIAGTIDLSGQAGSKVNDPLRADRRPADPGPGGYPGGIAAGFDLGPSNGFGPGFGSACGGGASHGTQGQPGCTGGVPFRTYDNIVLVPLRGGSGGGGGGSPGSSGGGGGGGGGAIRISSSVSISITGAILANGGDGGTGGISDFNTGGGGSGGAIHLISQTIIGAGTLTALGGGTNVWQGGLGRIRLDAFTQQFNGTANPQPTFGSPYAVPPPTAQPMIRVTSIAGVPIPPNPTGNFTTPDVVFNQTGPVPVNIQASNVPLNATVTLYFFSEVGPDMTVQAGPLAGPVQSSKATVQVTFQPGFTRGFVRATF